MARLALLLLAISACGSSDSESGPVISIDTERIELGDSACGTARTATVTVVNPGDAPLELAVESTLANVTVTPATATVAPGESLALAVTIAVPAATGEQTGALVVSSNAQVLAVPISLRSTGAAIALDRTAVDFGEVLPGDVVLRQVTVTATGTAPAEVKLATTGDAFRVFATSTIIAPGGSATVDVRFTAGATEQQHAGTLGLGVVSGCSQPAPIDLIGTATTDVVRLDRTLIDFGTLRCGEVGGGSGMLAITNHGVSVADYELDVTDPINWILVGAPRGSVNPNASASVLVGRRGVGDAPIGPFVGLVEVVINDGLATKPVSVRAQIEKPIVTPLVSALDFGTVPVGGSATRTFIIRNTGNFPTDLNMFTNSTEVTFSPQQFQLVPTVAQVVTATYRRTSAGAFDGIVTFGGDCEPIKSVTLHAN